MATTGPATRSSAIRTSHGAARHASSAKTSTRQSDDVQEAGLQPHALRVEHRRPDRQGQAAIFGSYEGNIQNRANRVDIPTPPTGFPALDTVNLTQYNGSFGSPFRENLLFGKLSGEINDKSSAELSFSNRHETDIRDFGWTTALSRRRTTFTTTTPSRSSSTTTSPGRGSTKRSRLHADSIAASVPTRRDCRTVSTSTRNGCCLRIGSARSHPGVHPERSRLPQRSHLHRIPDGGEHVIKGGVSSTSRPTTSSRTTTERRFRVPGHTQHRKRQPGLQLRDAVPARYGTGDPTCQDEQQADRRVHPGRLDSDQAVDAQSRRPLGLRDQHAEHELRDAAGVQSDTLTRYAANLSIPLDLNRYIATATIASRSRARSSRASASRTRSTRRAARRCSADGACTTIAFRSTSPSTKSRRSRTRLLHQLLLRAGCAGAAGQIAWNDSYLTADKATLDALVGRVGKPELWLIDNEFKVPQSTQWSVGVRQLFARLLQRPSATRTQQAKDLFTLGLANVGLNPDGKLLRLRRSTGAHTATRKSSILTNDAQDVVHAVQVQLDRPYTRASLDDLAGARAWRKHTPSVSWRALTTTATLFAFPIAGAIPKHRRTTRRSRIVAQLDHGHSVSLWESSGPDSRRSAASTRIDVGCRTVLPDRRKSLRARRLHDARDLPVPECRHAPA